MFHAFPSRSGSDVVGPFVRSEISFRRIFHLLTGVQESRYVRGDPENSKKQAESVQTFAAVGGLRRMLIPEHLSVFSGFRSVSKE